MKGVHDWIGFIVAVIISLLLAIIVDARNAMPAPLQASSLSLVAGPLPICLSGRTAHGEMERLNYRPALKMHGAVVGTVFLNDRSDRWISLIGQRNSPRACFVARGSTGVWAKEDASDE